MLEKLEEVAKKHYDGHFTVMRFTTNWRVCFYTAEDRNEIANMAEGKTFEEAAAKAIAIDVEAPKCWYKRLSAASDNG